MIKYIITILTFIVLVSSVTGCGASANISNETQTESEAPVDDNYGKGLSFTYTDYADNVLSLSYTLKRNANNQWQLSISGQNAHFNGTKIITDNKADTFFYYLVNETNIASYKDYNKTDDEITTDTAWWFNLNIYYEKDSIVAYGYMMHPSDYDDIRVKITEYLNELFMEV